jgi:hypothetical protein
MKLKKKINQEKNKTPKKKTIQIIKTKLNTKIKLNKIHMDKIENNLNLKRHQKQN